MKIILGLQYNTRDENKVIPTGTEIEWEDGKIHYKGKSYNFPKDWVTTYCKTVDSPAPSKKKPQAVVEVETAKELAEAVADDSTKYEKESDTILFEGQEVKVVATVESSLRDLNKEKTENTQKPKSHKKKG